MNAGISKVSPVLGVKRVRQAAEYYRDVLGFYLDPVDGVFQPSDDEPDGVYAIVKRNDTWIHFQIRNREASPRKRRSLERDIYIYVKDVEGLHADLKHRGAKIMQQPFEAPCGLREFSIEDLNGYRLTFGQPIP